MEPGTGAAESALGDRNVTSSSVDHARGILRNTAALFLVGVFAKGMGLVIAILIGRFLGTAVMGLFAFLFSLAMLLETFVSLGMSDSLVRDVAARPEQGSNLYLYALKLVCGISFVPALLLAFVAVLADVDESTRASLLVVAIGTPVSGAFVVSQAVLQGTERVLLLTWVTFLARLLSLIWLAVALYGGAGVEAAFVSRLLFQAASVAVFLLVLWRARTNDVADFTARDLLTRSVPFALNRAVGEVGARLPSLILPGTAGLSAAGIFDSANRIRSTLGMTIAAAIVGLMPSFARNFSDPGAKSERLVGYSIKYMCLAMAAVATLIDLAAEWIISLLFGVEFEAASRLLQLLVWVQVFVAVDAVLQQAMLAAGHSYATVRHSVAGVVGQLVLIFLLVSVLGLTGVALAVLLSSALTLLLNLRYVVKNVSAIPIVKFAVAPLTAAVLVAGMMFVVHDRTFVVRLLVSIVAWGVAMSVFRLLPREEFGFMRRVVSLPGGGRSANLDQDK